MEVEDLSQEAMSSYRDEFLVRAIDNNKNPSLSRSLPEYPSSIPLNSTSFDLAKVFVIKSYEDAGNHSGWKTALEKSVNLELERVRPIYNNQPLFQSMQRIGTKIINSGEYNNNVLLPPSNISKPTSTEEEEEKFRLLQELVESYERELKEWEDIEREYNNKNPKFAEKIQEMTISFENEEDDMDLAKTLLSTCSNLANNVNEILETSKNRMLKIEDEIKESALETESLVGTYFQNTFEEDVQKPKMLITSLAKEGTGLPRTQKLEREST